MAELTLLLPDERALQPLPEELRRWLARGDALPDAAPGRDAQLREHFEFIGTGIPVAALTRSLDSADARGTWLRADPAWIMPDAVTLRLMACGDVGLTEQESGALARALKPLFGDAGFPLEATTTSRWYLRCPEGARLPQFSPPGSALGADIAGHLPDGGDSRQWRHLLNEAQVILHNHPVNAERAQRGAVPVNSVWFWGAGKLPEWVRSRHGRVFSSDILAEALARIAGKDLLPPSPDAIGEIDPEQTILVDLAPATASGDVGAWCRKIAALLDARAIDAVVLAFADGRRCSYRRAHRWRFWRRIPTS